MRAQRCGVAIIRLIRDMKVSVVVSLWHQGTVADLSVEEISSI